MTDEVLLTYYMKIHNMIPSLSCAINHSCSFPYLHLSPTKYVDGYFYAKYPDDVDYQKVLLFHCNPEKRDPTEGADEEMKSRVREIFYL